MNNTFKQNILSLVETQDKIKKYQNLSQHLYGLLLPCGPDDHYSAKDCPEIFMNSVNAIQAVENLLTKEESKTLENLITKVYLKTDQLLEDSWESNQQLVQENILFIELIKDEWKQQDCICVGARLILNKLSTEGKNAEKYEYLKDFLKQKNEEKLIYKDNITSFVYSNSQENLEKFLSDLMVFRKKHNIIGNIDFDVLSDDKLIKTLLTQNKLGANVDNFNQFSYDDLKQTSPKKDAKKSTTLKP
jgi:hypothetical protein